VDAGDHPAASFLDDCAARWRSDGVFDGIRRFAVGFSGGPDSTALLSVARRLVPELLDCAVHVDHGMHPDSAAAATAAARIARSLDVPFVCVTVTTEPAGRGREDAARRAREAAFVRVAGDRGLDAVATGHTADDQAETVLLALLRGTGTDGASAMPQRRALRDSTVTLLRPLLHARRSDAAAWCGAQGLVPLVDPTNADMTLLRNRVRAELVPLLEELRPGAVDRIAAAAALFAEDRAVLDALAADAAVDAVASQPDDAVASQPDDAVASQPDDAVASQPDSADTAVVFDRAALAALPYALASRVVRRAIAPWCGGLPPRRAAVDAVLDGRGGTLPGTALDCRVAPKTVTLTPHGAGRRTLL
jgi:tRNA(Ile)-lysidine synthetase-like protein